MRERPAKSSGVVKPHPAKWHGKVAAFVIYGLVRVFDLTLRYKLEDPAGALDRVRGGPVIFSIWHNRLALCLMLYRRYVQQASPNRRMAAMVSASHDGGMLAYALALFGVKAVRGSTSRRGPQALLEITTWIEEGYDAAMTPDGPRGPRYIVQDGVLAAAQLTGLPIVPVSYHLSRKRELGSWDRFQVPMPFSTCTVRLGEPLDVPREAADEQREALRLELERRMKGITVD